VDNDGDPTCSPHTGLLPENMAFDAETQEPYDDYRGKLVDPAYEADVSGEARDPVEVE